MNNKMNFNQFFEESMYEILNKKEEIYNKINNIEYQNIIKYNYNNICLLLPYTIILYKIYKEEIYIEPQNLNKIIRSSIINVFHGSNANLLIYDSPLYKEYQNYLRYICEKLNKPTVIDFLEYLTNKTHNKYPNIDKLKCFKYLEDTVLELSSSLVGKFKNVSQYNKIDSFIRKDGEIELKVKLSDKKNNKTIKEKTFNEGIVIGCNKHNNGDMVEVINGTSTRSYLLCREAISETSTNIIEVYPNSKKKIKYLENLLTIIENEKELINKKIQELKLEYKN